MLRFLLSLFFKMFDLTVSFSTRHRPQDYRSHFQKLFTPTEKNREHAIHKSHLERRPRVLLGPAVGEPSALSRWEWRAVLQPQDRDRGADRRWATAYLRRSSWTWLSSSSCLVHSAFQSSRDFSTPKQRMEKKKKKKEIKYLGFK